MTQQQVKQIADYIFKDVLGVDNPYTLKELQSKFAIDIPPLRQVKCALSGEDTWSFSSKDEKVASQKAIADRFKKDEWMRKKQDFQTIEDILKAWQEINYQVAEKYINSKEVSQSDGIYNSSQVHGSVSIFDSKNIVFGYKLFSCNYMLASRDNSSCTLSIRVKESIYTSSSFEASWSNKVSKCMFVHDCYDLYECLFCSHIRSKKYCIANIQFEKEEYFKLKKLIIDWILTP